MMRDKVFAALLIGGAMALGTLSAAAESFDKPLKRKVVDLGRSQLLMPNATEHIKLRCFYYPSFMIKKLDDPGNKGALFIELVPVQSGDSPRCTRQHSVGERAFKDGGYFTGVKLNLVFIQAADGLDGGINFMAYDSKTCAKVFQDVSTTHPDAAVALDFINVSETQITLRYPRVFSGKCSIPTHGEACWKTFQQQTSLTHAPMPKCSTYEGDREKDDPSVITYPVEVSLFPKPSRKPISNPVSCSAAE